MLSDAAASIERLPVIIPPRAQASRRCETQATLSGKPQAELAFRSLGPFRALHEPDCRRRDEERPFRSEQKTGNNQNDYLTGKAPYKSCELSVPGRRCGRPFADRHGSVESLPFDDNRFDKALAINSMQYWPQAVAGLRELQRVMKADGRIALGFSPYSGQPNKGLPETLTAAGFRQAHVVESDKGFSALATK